MNALSCPAHYHQSSSSSNLLESLSLLSKVSVCPGNCNSWTLPNVREERLRRGDQEAFATCQQGSWWKCVSRCLHAGSGAEFHKCVQIAFGHSHLVCLTNQGDSKRSQLSRLAAKSQDTTATACSCVRNELVLKADWPCYPVSSFWCSCSLILLTFFCITGSLLKCHASIGPVISMQCSMGNKLPS